MYILCHYFVYETQIKPIKYLYKSITCSLSIFTNLCLSLFPLCFANKVEIGNSTQACAMHLQICAGAMYWYFYNLASILRQSSSSILVRSVGLARI